MKLIRKILPASLAIVILISSNITTFASYDDREIISQKTYTDEYGANVTETIYYTPVNIQRSSTDTGQCGLSQSGVFEKSKEFDWLNGRVTTITASGFFTWNGENVEAINASGWYDYMEPTAEVIDEDVTDGVSGIFTKKAYVKYYIRIKNGYGIYFSNSVQINVDENGNPS